ncbi:MAG: type II/IV secretion system ATPase subunit [Thaumarchaeota archaeon]|nr:type II/IV secretion system ATPase subunit [Nitrososphaerota archaeon]MDD9813038.1 type II/IV secretion system ATPase subunit [Nitrososphaerota archaeon]MDD9842319.1 type II/IV secretion system ATPase subunit [Nitrososphaerota archaeon]RNJ72451.1 MAG: hypothetical protein EB832_03825 [Thaumarchaeota archaeon S14]RNJ73044.1 MAG: hypothetical protein EB833_03575 [Thaumarchaeota archaeon S13]
MLGTRRQDGKFGRRPDMMEGAIRDMIRDGVHRELHALDVGHASVPRTITEAEVVDSYGVGDARVFVTGDGRYIVSEPEVTPELEGAIHALASHLYMSMDAGPAGRPDASEIEGRIWQAASELGLSETVSSHHDEIAYYVRRAYGYWGLDVLFRDDNIEDIMIPGRAAVGVVLRAHKGHPVYRTNVRLGTDAEFDSLVTRILEKCDAHASNAEPIVDAVTPEGDRVSVAFRREVSAGTAMNVRKFSRTPLTIADLIRGGMLTPMMAAYWWTLVDAMSFNIVVGVTSSGKTTLANALLALAHPDWMIVTVEDTPEMRLPHTHLLSLRTRASALNKSLSYRIEDLIPVTLRHNPHLVIVGEARSRDAIYAAFENAAAGHGGVTTLHAPSAKKTIERVRFAGVDSTYLSLLWTVWHCREVRSPRHGRAVRRVAGVDEVSMGHGGGPEPRMDTIFSHAVLDDTFTEYAPRELVARSARLREAAESLGLEDPAEDIARRVSILEGCVASNPRSPAEVMRATALYYRA